MISDLAPKNEDFEMKVDSLVIALKSLICHSSLYHKGFSFALENIHQKLWWCTQLLPHVLWRPSTGDLKIGWRQHISRYGIHTHKIGGRFYFLRRGKNNQKGRGFWYFLCCCVFLCVLSVHHFSYWPSETSFSLLVSDNIPRVQSQIVICRSFYETTKFRFLYNKNIKKN